MKIRRLLYALSAVFILTLVTVAAVAFGSVSPQSQEAAAGTHESVEQGGPFFVQSLPCPDDILEYAAENTIRYVRSMYGNGTSSLDYDTVTLGHPFTYTPKTKTPLFYFPVYSGNTVICTIRVMRSPYDGTILSVGSTFLADELNAYRNRTSADCPLLFDITETALYVCLGEEKEKVCDFSEWDQPDIQNDLLERTSAKVEPVDITVPIEIQGSWELPYAGTMSKELPLSITETQSSGNYWCTAYCTAAVYSCRKK